MSPTAYDNWLVNIREDHDSLPSIEEQQAFLDFINHKTSADEAASAYTHVETNRKYPNADSLWLLLWLAAGEWPETHEHLIELLKAIKRLPPVSRGDNKEEGSVTEYWSALPYFEFGLREYWDGKAYRILHDADPKLHIAFINLTSFNATLFRHAIFDLETWALMTLSLALEKDYEKQSHLLDTWVPAAAQYILQTGPTVYRCDEESLYAGPLLKKARDQGPIERWAFWKEKFASMQQREDLKDSTRAMGKQVVRHMEDIEKEYH